MLPQDPARAFNLVQQEARNTVTRTPEGLETPAYRVARQGEGSGLRVSWLRLPPLVGIHLASTARLPRVLGRSFRAIRRWTGSAGSTSPSNTSFFQSLWRQRSSLAYWEETRARFGTPPTPPCRYTF